MRPIAAADPGLKGGVALLWPDLETVDVWAMPVLPIQRGGKDKFEIDHAELGALMTRIASCRPELFLIEQVGGMTRDAASAAFQFGATYGALQQSIADARMPMQTVTPAVWKKYMGVSTDKKSSRTMASRLLPRSAHQWTRDKDDGKAEAALLAIYGHRFVLRNAK